MSNRPQIYLPEIEEFLSLETEVEYDHFVYALDLGHFSRKGIPLRIFGRSSKKSFASRYGSYQSAAWIQPILCGAIPCNGKEDACRTEYTVLKRFKQYAPPERPLAEIRLATKEVLDFIENEMVDGREFLGMRTIDWINRQHREKSLCPEHRGSERDRIQTYRLDPDFVEREKARRIFHDRPLEIPKGGGTSRGQISFF